jgi:hypothetical protein
MAVAATVELDRADLDAIEVGKRGAGHRQPIGDRRDVAHPALLPGDVGRRHEHAVQRKNMTNTNRRNDVADVGRVECSTENADPFTTAAHGRSLGASPRAYRALGRKTPADPTNVPRKTDR